MKFIARLLAAAMVVSGGLAKASDDSITARLTGAVFDASGAPVPGAQVVVRIAGDAIVADVRSDSAGAFGIDGLPAGNYVVSVESGGFSELRQALRLSAGQTTRVDLTLQIAGIFENLTVTPVRGELSEVHETAEFVSAAASDTLSRRAIGILPLALREEPGVQVQQTSTSQGSVFVRGLTGQQVVTLIDGVRYNTSTFRPGANQYAALIDLTAVERVEVVRGPGAVQYGSDSLGGTVNILTRAPRLLADDFRARGGATLVGGSADLSMGGSAWALGGWRRWAFLAQGSGRRSQDLRTGGGIDSHSVVTRLLGLPSTVLRNRLQETGYRQYGGGAKLSYYSTSAGSLTLEYLNGGQFGAQRYDQLNGGAGNLLHRFDPQTLDFAMARYERASAGFLDTLTSTFSANSQRDDRTFQNINSRTGLRSRITEEQNRTTVFGYQAQGTSHIGDRHALAFGAEYYDESIASSRVERSFSTVTGGFTDAAHVRARFPNGAVYQTLGVFAHDSVRLSNRLSASLGIRASSIRFAQSPDGNPVAAAGPTVPAFATRMGDTTFHANAVFALTQHVNLTGSVSRGFRAPNLNDFASIGLSGAGFETTSEEGRRLGGRTRRFDADGAGDPVEPLQPEESYNFEAGLRLRTARVSATLAVFDAEILNFIERRALLLPVGAVGGQIGGQPIVRQDPSGAVYTGLSATSVFVRANAGHVRMRGAEGAVTGRISRDLTFRANVSSVYGKDLRTGRPPGLENGIPPTHGFVGVQWQRAEGKSWLEMYSLFAAPQRRLSDNDFQQARIGGIRTRQEIGDFFGNGAVARGLVRDGRLLATGETLDEVVRRVIGSDPAARVPLFYSNPGYATVNVRGGLRLNTHATFSVIVENLLDRNYRVMGSGIDAPGINVMIRQTFEF